MVRFIPCAVHPDKGAPAAAAKARIEMLRLINCDGLHVDTRETDRGGVSYTIDTLSQIRGEIGRNTPLAFVAGEDVLSTIEDWEHAEEIAALVHLIVLRRPGCACPKPSLWSQVADMKELSRHPGGRLLRFANQLTDVSSTAIRRMLARGEQPHYMIPGVVWNYIRRHRLYGWKAPDAI